MHLCPVCTAAVIQIIADNSPAALSVWTRFKLWARGVFKKPNSTEECIGNHAAH